MGHQLQQLSRYFEAGQDESTSSAFSRELLALQGITEHRQESPEPILGGLSSVTARLSTPGSPKAQRVPRDGGQSTAMLRLSPQLCCWFVWGLQPRNCRRVGEAPRAAEHLQSAEERVRGSRLPHRAPQAPASAAFPSCSLAGFSRGSARPRAIYFDLGTESRVLESDHPNSGKCRASPSREGRVPSSKRAGSIGNHPQQRNPGGRQLPSLRLQLRICVASGTLCSLPVLPPAPPGWQENRLPRGEILPGSPAMGSRSRASRGLTAAPPPPAHVGRPQAPSDAPALSPSRACGCTSFPKCLHQHLQLQPGGQPAQEPRGSGLRPTKLVACGPLHGAQPPLPPRPLRRTGQSPGPSATAPLPSQGGREGSAQA